VTVSPGTSSGGVTHAEEVEMRGVPEQPAGLAYGPDLLDAGEERDLLALLSELPLHEVRMHSRAPVGLAKSVRLRCLRILVDRST
jgi:hypothetical protein